MDLRPHTSTTELRGLYVPRLTGCTTGAAERYTRPCAHLHDAIFFLICAICSRARAIHLHGAFFSLLCKAILTCLHTRFPSIDALPLTRSRSLARSLTGLLRQRGGVYARPLRTSLLLPGLRRQAHLLPRVPRPHHRNDQGYPCVMYREMIEAIPV